MNSTGAFCRFCARGAAGSATLERLMVERPSVRAVSPWCERSDAELARAVADDVERSAAEAELCARFAPRLGLYARRHVGAEEAAELVQRVLVLTLEKLRRGEVREPERIASFVLGAARMTAHGLRRERRQDPSAELVDVAAPACEGADPLLGEQLVRCLEALSERERDTLVATYYGEQPSEHIARSWGIRPDHVRQLRRRALARVRACLGLDAEVGA